MQKNQFQIEWIALFYLFPRFELTENIMLRKKIINTCLLLALILLFSGSLVAGQRLILGAKLLGSGWQGNNADGTEFNSDNGGQLGVNLAWQTDKFYSGLNLQNGNYDFTGTAPDQFTSTGSAAVATDQVQQSEVDILVGYYFWPQVSLFVDMKTVENQWKSNNYKQTFAGLGLGVTGYNPLNKDWTLFGSLGFVSGDIKESGGSKVGDGSSSALEIGLLYTLNKNSFLNFGVKFRGYEFKSDNGAQQDYNINALFFGYTHAFHLD